MSASFRCGANCQVVEDKDIYTTPSAFKLMFLAEVCRAGQAMRTSASMRAVVPELGSCGYTVV